MVGTVTRRQTLLLGFLNRQALFVRQLLLDVKGDLLVSLVKHRVAALGLVRLCHSVDNGVVLLLLGVSCLGGVAIRGRLHIDQTGLTGVALHVEEGVVVLGATKRGLVEVEGPLERLVEIVSEIQISVWLAVRLLHLLPMKSAVHFILLLVEERHPVDRVSCRPHLVALEQRHLLLTVDVGLHYLEL